MRKYLLGTLLVLLAVIIVLAGCSKSSPTTTASKPATQTTSLAPATTSATASTPTTATVKKGGILRILSNLGPSTMPGWPGNTKDFQRIWCNCIVYENIVKLDYNGNPTPWLATDWTFGPQNTYIDFNLRKDVKFHDGTDFTAESVVAHYKQLFLDKDAAVSTFDRIEKTGDYSVRIYIKSFSNDFWFNRIGASTQFITSDTMLKEKGLDYVKEHPCGTGPFTLKSFTKDVGMKFEKNPNYWKKDAQGYQLPYLDGIDYIVVKDITTMQVKMEAREGDVMCLISDGKVIKALADKGMAIGDRYQSAWFLEFDTVNAGKPTNNPKVRMALEYALNKKEIADTLGSGYMKPANQLGGDPNSVAFNPNLGTRDYNVEKAKQLLTEAGYPGGGFTLKLTTDSSQGSQESFAVMIQNYFKAVGVTVNIETVDNAKYLNYNMTSWDGFYCISWSMSPSFAAYLLKFFSPTSTYNKSAKLPQEITDKVNAAMVETDQNKFKTMNLELSQWVWDNAYFIPICSFNSAYIYQPNVRDYGYAKFIDFTQWNSEKCWLDR
jgi:peptide/nickel transport system substrate-binding protein